MWGRQPALHPSECRRALGEASPLGCDFRSQCAAGWRCCYSVRPLGEEVSGADPGFPHLPLQGRVTLELGGKCTLSHKREEFLTSSRRGQRGHITRYFGQPCAKKNHSTQNARGTPLRNATQSPCIYVSPRQPYHIYESPSVQHDPGFNLKKKIFCC